MTQKCIVARPTGGVSINGNEFLLDSPNGDYMVFDDKTVALEFVRENIFPESTDDELNGYFTFFNHEKALDDVFEEVE